MLTITGEVRKVLDKTYKDKQKNSVAQAVVIIEPEYGSQNYEIFLNKKQIEAGAKDAWLKLKGRVATVSVSLFVNHEYRFHKFNATFDAKPVERK
jgi:hypothetical protein